jgi:hypothetical protein
MESLTGGLRSPIDAGTVPPRQRTTTRSLTWSRQTDAVEQLGAGLNASSQGFPHFQGTHGFGSTVTSQILPRQIGLAGIIKDSGRSTALPIQGCQGVRRFLSRSDFEG